ncbi:OmpA family protein [Burkholderia pseudomallei]|uniref:OmpA family protein n=1 Tax=Burkholderia pseudomallei TaxID=28450 RepID=UPI001AD6536E|nr:OmpA family protein [Burkholderia pseudomallei]MBO7932026.1 OmpA family protein [Burkholderia pseudomallei]
MKLHVISLTCATLMAACTTSGPTYNLDIVKLENGKQTYRVQCQGLLETSKTCVDRARKVCGDNNYRLISRTGTVDGAYEPDDPNEMLFACGDAQEAAASRVSEKTQQVSPIALSGDTSFAVNSAALTPAATESLNRFAEATRGKTLDTLTISGHTDSTGTVALNDRLSDARAHAVEAYLTSHGVRARQLIARGYGSRMPVASNSTDAGRARNRRVEIAVDSN